MKITKHKIKRVFSKMQDIACNEDGPNPYQGQIYFLDGDYYAINPWMMIRFTVTLSGGSYEPGKLYVLEDYDATGRWVEVTLGQNVRTEQENARGTADWIRKLMAFNEQEHEGPVRFKLATNAGLLMQALEPFKILDLHVFARRDHRMLHIYAQDSTLDLCLEAAVMNWKGR